jgi:uncharacterized protein (TIGR00369 family)
MDIRTHERIDTELCGTPLVLEKDVSRVTLTPSERMAADASGLVHGGFLFGLADYAAMIAVNDPNVVLGAAEVKFLKPVVVGDTVVAEARVEEVSGRRRNVRVTVVRGEEEVFNGTFACYVLEQHVLSG